MTKIKSIFSDWESLITFGVIILITIIAATLVGKYLKHMLVRKTKDASLDITNFIFVQQVVVVTIYLFGFGWALLSLPISANFAHSLFAGAGASTLIIGFASQQILSNFMSGIVLVVKKPFRINDTVNIQGNTGRVTEINLHDTVLVDENGDLVIIPNSLISNGVIKNIKHTPAAPPPKPAEEKVAKPK